MDWEKKWLPLEAQLKVRLTGNRKYDLKTSCLPTVMYVMRYFFHIFKNQDPTKMML